MNNDGVLNKEELIAGYRKIYGNFAEEEVAKILERVDADGSGEIDYSEWLVATINKEKYLSEKKLKIAFELFDQDGGGSISSDEIKEILCKGQEIDEEVWKEVINQVDKDGNGEIEFEEFSQMMRAMMVVEDGSKSQIASKNNSQTPVVQKSDLPLKESFKLPSIGQEQGRELKVVEMIEDSP